MEDPREAQRRIEELETELAALRRELWAARDAVIGAEAESASLKVRNRELEVRLGQLTQLLDDQRSFERLVGRIRGNRYLRAVGRGARTLGRPGG